MPAQYFKRTGFVIQTVEGVLAEKDLGAGRRNDCMLLRLSMLYLRRTFPMLLVSRALLLRMSCGRCVLVRARLRFKLPLAVAR